MAPSPEKQVGAARDSPQGSSVRRESFDGTRHNKGAAMRQQYNVADKLKWLDRVHFEHAGAPWLGVWYGSSSSHISQS